LGVIIHVNRVTPKAVIQVLDVTSVSVAQILFQTHAIAILRQVVAEEVRVPLEPQDQPETRVQLEQLEPLEQLDQQAL
jgi:hypothetical protein